MLHTTSHGSYNGIQWYSGSLLGENKRTTCCLTLQVHYLSLNLDKQIFNLKITINRSDY